MGKGWIGLLLLVPLLGHGAAPQSMLAWRSAKGDQLLQFTPQRLLSQQPLPSTQTTPLGSVWKLFVYSWLVDTAAQEPAYQCRGQDSEERYCCSVGQRIGRDEALVKSCGLYFDPLRLGIDPQQWRSYWQAHQAPAWVAELVPLPMSSATAAPSTAIAPTLAPDLAVASMANPAEPIDELADADSDSPPTSERARLAMQNAATEVPVAQLLTALQLLPAQERARQVLLDVSLASDERRATAVLGGRLRAKTWSWHRADGALVGGFAGWLLDGSPIWMAGPGTSRVVLANYGKVLGEWLPTPWPSELGGCVEVSLFARYPAQEVFDQQGRPATDGPLNGRFDVRFASGDLVEIVSHGDIYLHRFAQTLTLIARVSEEEYVARVLDREASPTPREAAKALAVTIRTYLQQNAVREGDCLRITDSTLHQRMAPRPATRDAKEITAWSSGLILVGGAVTYHAEQSGVGKLSWREAVTLANKGLTFDLILAQAFPYLELGRAGQEETHCKPIAEAARWLAQQQRLWRQRLAQEPGYETPTGFAVCQLGSGRPYADKQRQRIYVRGLYTQQDRLDLAHEYLHLAFQSHPNGDDEAYIERWARHLILE